MGFSSETQGSLEENTNCNDTELLFPGRQVSSDPITGRKQEGGESKDERNNWGAPRARTKSKLLVEKHKTSNLVGRWGREDRNHSTFQFPKKKNGGSN